MQRGWIRVPVCVFSFGSAAIFGGLMADPSTQVPIKKPVTDNVSPVVVINTEAPKILITSPTYGKYLEFGTTQDISFNYSGYIGRLVRIVAHNADTNADVRIQENFDIRGANKFTYHWTVPNSAPAGFYKIVITSIGSANVVTGQAPNGSLNGEILLGDLLVYIGPNKFTRYKGKDLKYQSIHDEDLSNYDFTGSDLTGATLRNVKLDNVILTGVNLTKVYMEKVTLTNANMTGANLTEAFMKNVPFANANLTGANLTRAKLMGANFNNTNLTNANLTEASVRGATFYGAEMKGAVLDRVDKDPYTFNGAKDVGRR